MCVESANDVDCYRVEQELMARIVSEMRNRQCYSTAVQSQLNPGQRSLGHVSELSSTVSDVETTDDPIIGLCHANKPLLSQNQKDVYF